jgi:hypothetical protein
MTIETVHEHDIASWRPIALPTHMDQLCHLAGSSSLKLGFRALIYLYAPDSPIGAIGSHGRKSRTPRMGWT